MKQHVHVTCLHLTYVKATFVKTVTSTDVTLLFDPQVPKISNNCLICESQGDTYTPAFKSEVNNTKFSVFIFQQPHPKANNCPFNCSTK